MPILRLPKLLPTKLPCNFNFTLVLHILISYVGESPYIYLESLKCYHIKIRSNTLVIILANDRIQSIVIVNNFWKWQNAKHCTCKPFLQMPEDKALYMYAILHQIFKWPNAKHCTCKLFIQMVKCEAISIYLQSFLYIMM